jgi:hypothetical protein
MSIPTSNGKANVRPNCSIVSTQASALIRKRSRIGKRATGIARSLVGVNLTPSPIEQFQVLVERHRQKT